MCGPPRVSGIHATRAHRDLTPIQPCPRLLANEECPHYSKYFEYSFGIAVIG